MRKYNRKSRRINYKTNYPNLELIIIDDGSDDNSNFIIRNLNDDRIKKFIQKNKGLVFCLNLGVNSSKGSYIARMDTMISLCLTVLLPD